MLVKFIFTFALANLALSNADYCDTEGLRCKNGEHIGCQFADKDFDFITKKCHKWNDVELFDFDNSTIQDYIVHIHNQKKSEAGLGIAVEGATATKMCTLVS